VTLGALRPGRARTPPIDSQNVAGPMVHQTGEATASHESLQPSISEQPGRISSSGLLRYVNPIPGMETLDDALTLGRPANPVFDFTCTCAGRPRRMQSRFSFAQSPPLPGLALEHWAGNSKAVLEPNTRNEHEGQQTIVQPGMARMGLDVVNDAAGVACMGRQPKGKPFRKLVLKTALRGLNDV
jgi:hypothetical protein